MTTPEPGDRGNPFQFLLGDLMKMLGGASGAAWETSRAFALQVATDGEAEGNVDPVQRIRVEELCRVAELHVAEATGLPVTPDGQRLTCLPVGRGDWALRALEAWRPVLEAMTPPAGAPAVPPGTDLTADLTTGADDLSALMGMWAGTIGPMLTALQAGSVVGHLAQRAVGQYVLPLPWPANGELLVVPSNVEEFASDWSLPAEEALLWVCARELAANSVVGRPHVHARLTGLLTELAGVAAATQQGLMDRLGGPMGGMADPEAISNLFSDPDALLADLLLPDARRPSEQLTALAIVIDAYADRIADRVGTALTGSHAQLAEAWYRRRIERGRGEEAAAALFGIDVDTAQVDRGRSFLAGVVERSDEAELTRLWASPSNLPTPAEVDAPGLWLERIRLPELDEPGG
ncbi:MAG: zinc-dependent metalloprotease [Actinomycetota bacterium]|nr:zinc-dependent metalloprotease [Actinomycetota bacterium]